MIHRSAAAMLALTALVLHPAASVAAPDAAALERLATRFQLRLEARQGPAYQSLQSSALPDDETVELIFVEPRGFPRYYGTDNIIAAQTVSTDHVHPGGGFGFTVTGSGTAFGRLAVWDGGAVRTTHQEFGGRAVQADSYTSQSSHSTHVAGTMIAAGVNASAKGMSYGGRLDCYQWNSDNAEMAAAAAAGLSISSHSYGYVTGWRFSTSDGYWYWYGEMSVSPTEDYGFGFYSDEARAWDQIAYDAPEYLIFASAGNDRNDSGPSPGAQHYHWDGGWVLATDTHDPDGGATGHDTIPWNKNAKNIMTMGAVNDVPGGYGNPAGVTMSTFSAWGPTDDGRIKPDIVANGVQLTSSVASSNTAYDSYSGTSMATPNASGSVNLIREHWEDTHGTVPRAATLKGIVIQTADECGPADGPDYSFGWGLLNTLHAVQLVSDDAAAPADHAQVWEAELAQGEEDLYYFDLDAVGPVTLTLSWTDVPGTPVPAELDPADLMLVNDLDLRFDAWSGPVRAFPWEPWVLDPASPASPATTGDNFRDNAERIDANDVPAGRYVVSISHKGTLTNGPQAYTLVASVPVTDVSPPTASPASDGTITRLALRASPNPAVGSVAFTIDVPVAGEVSLSIHDVAGRLVQTLASGPREAGTLRLEWDGRAASGHAVPAGVYFARLRTPAGSHAERLVLLGR